MTSVAGTSVVVPALVDEGPLGDVARKALDLGEERLIAPALLDTEGAQTLRGRVLGGKLREPLAAAALHLQARGVRRSPLIRRLRGSGARVEFASSFPADLQHALDIIAAES